MFNPFNLFRKRKKPEYTTYQFCPRCDANLTLQKGFDPTAYSWICKGCGEMLINDSADTETDIVWICDGCGEVLNTQAGFDEYKSEWECTRCGYLNSVTEQDLYLSEDEYKEALLEPTRGMSDQDVLELSMYEELESIPNHENILIVRNVEDGTLYIKKILQLSDTSLYEYLMEHPVANMPKIIGVFQGQSYMVIIEEYIEGNTLEDLIENNRLEPMTAIIIAEKICHIASKLHQAPTPIIHRDIKASNVIISGKGEVYLLDMDAAKWYNSTANEDTVLMGTRHYAAPEQYGFTEESSSAKTDIYAQGILLNKMLTGRYPKDQKAEMPFWTVIEKCIQLQPEDRISDEELAMLLEHLREAYNEG